MALTLVTNFILATALSILAFGGVYFLKRASALWSVSAEIDDVLASVINAMKFPYIWLSMACYVLAFILFGFLLRNQDVSKLFPSLVGYNVLLTLLGAYLFLGEKFNFTSVVGVLLIIAGIVLVHGQRV